MSVEWDIYIALSAVMFLEYAVWGAWAPVLAARLLGPLKMTGKQTGWIYATLPLACIVSPLVGGQLADQWFATKWILAAAHLAGAVLLFLAANKRTFTGLFVVMLFYSIFYAATMPLVNSVVFHHVADDFTLGRVFIWAPVAWALVGYCLTGWRWRFKTEGEGRDCLYFASILSVAMVVACLLLPTNELAKSGEIPIVQAFSMLSDSNFLIFIVISLAVTGMMQFYFLGTARFMQDMGIPGKNVPASMAIAQVAQAIATFFALSYLLGGLGYKWTLTIGAGCWLAMYAVYIATKPRWLIVVFQAFHGLAYVFFIIAGQWYANAIAPEAIRSSMQALVFAATVGVGLFLGTQLAGIVMDQFSSQGKFHWRQIWLVPGAVMLAGVLALAGVLQDPPPAEEAAPEAAAEDAPEAAHHLRHDPIAGVGEMRV